MVAFNPACTHLGCAYHWDESPNNFVCPCHASVFSIDGKVLVGPAPRPWTGTWPRCGTARS